MDVNAAFYGIGGDPAGPQPSHPIGFEVSSRSAANQCASASPGTPCAYK